jgi:uncharacterized membrane protein
MDFSMETRGKANRSSGVAPVVERNIKTLIAQRQKEEANLTWQERLAGLISRFAGSFSFLLLHVVVFGLWILINCGVITGIHRFDPTLVKLAVAVSVEAVFLSTFILITQRRMMAQADRRADLNLQISLLAEYEVTRLITMTRAIAEAMDINEGREPELEELAQDIAPEQVLQTMDEQERRVREGGHEA